MNVTLAFTKGGGRSDRLDILRADGSCERIECPKQGIIPHDMVHYAVESVLDARGFLGRIATGERADFRMTAEAESDGVERFVEVIQGDAWSGGESDAAAILDLYRVTCEARGCPALAIDAATVDAVRDRMGTLSREWAAMPIGGVLTLCLER